MMNSSDGWLRAKAMSDRYREAAKTLRTIGFTDLSEMMDAESSQIMIANDIADLCDLLLMLDVPTGTTEPIPNEAATSDDYKRYRNSGYLPSSSQKEARKRYKREWMRKKRAGAEGKHVSGSD